MGWVKLHDDFPDHPKVAAAGAMAGWLYICGLGYCSRFLTDGRIPADRVARLADLPKAMQLAERLVEVGLWERDGNEFVVHDYLDWQESAERIIQKREAARARRSGKPPPKPPHKPPDVPATVARTSSEPTANGAEPSHDATATFSDIDVQTSRCTETTTASPLSAAAEEPPPTAEIVPISNGHPPWLDILGPRLADLDTTGTWDLLTPYVESWDMIHDFVEPPHVMGNLIALTCDFVTRVTGEPPPDSDRSRIAMLVRSHGKAALLGYSKALGATEEETPEARFKYARGVINRFIRELEATG